MVGRILHQELLLGGRRHRLHLFRWLYAFWLVLTVVLLFLQFLSEEASVARTRLQTGGAITTLHASAADVVGARFAALFVWQQTLLIFLAVPLFAAGSVIDEKRQGTLQYLLLSEVEPRHLVLGKLLGRVLQVFLWLLVGLPPFALLAGFGGISPTTLAFLALGLLMPVYGLGALSLLASVWCRQTRDAVLVVYLVLVAGWVGSRLLGPVRYLDPLWVLEPAWTATLSLDLDEAIRRLLAGGVSWGVLGSLFLGLAAVRLLPVYRKELENRGATSPHWYTQEREPIDEPVRWREQHVEGLAPNATLRQVPTWLGVAAVSLAATISSLVILRYSLVPGANVAELLQALLQLNVRGVGQLLPDASTGFLIQGVVVMLLASLIVGVRCAGTIVQERERQTWEALLLTPLSARQIVRGKLWGIIQAGSWYLLAYAAPAVALSVVAGPLALIYTVAWLAATVLAMYFLGAAGLWCSVRASTSWRSLLQTMGFGYLGGLLVYIVSSPVLFIVAFLFLLVLAFIDVGLNTQLASLCLRNLTYFARLFYLASATGLIVLFWLLARFFIYRAQRWIADRDRTRHWHDEPIYRRSRPSETLPTSDLGGW